MLAVVDGDYCGLTYHSNENPKLSEQMSHALVQATFESAGVMRELPGILPETGWEIQSTIARPVAEIGQELSYWKTFAEAYMPRVVEGGLLSKEECQMWWRDQMMLSEAHKSFVNCTYITVLAKAI